MKQLEIEQLKADDPVLYALAIEMERLYRAGPHFRGDNKWTVRAEHRVTREKAETVVLADDAAGAREQFRQQVKDTVRPYQWKLGVSQAVPGLGRSFKWEGL